MPGAVCDQQADCARLTQADAINERALTTAVAAAVEIDIPDNLIVENARRRFEEQLASLAEKVLTWHASC